MQKLGVPSQPELALGAVGEDAKLVENERVAGRVHLSEAEFAEMQRRGREEVRAGRGGCAVTGRGSR